MVYIGVKISLVLLAEEDKAISHVYSQTGDFVCMNAYISRIISGTLSKFGLSTRLYKSVCLRTQSRLLLPVKTIKSVHNALLYFKFQLVAHISLVLVPLLACAAL